MRKKRISILLGTAVLASMLAGCGGESQSGSTQSADAAEGGRMTLQLWTSSRDAIDHPDAWYIKKIEDEFDVDIEMMYRNEGGTDYSEWLTLSLAGDDCPDWFRDQTVSTSMLNDLVKQGLVAKLDPEMVKENMPNYMKWAEKYSDIMTEDPLNLYSVDGEVYAIPDAKVDLGRFCLMAYRQDWLDNLGLQAPETLDEFTEVMKAFTFDDPDGNGVDDTYGYIGITGNADWAFSPIFAAFGTYPGIWYAKEDGTITRGEIEPETKEALKYIKELYDMGVIDPEWMTIDFEGAKNKVVSSVVGCSWQNWLSILTPDGWWSALKEAEPEASWSIATGMEGTDGQKGIMQFNPLAGVGIVFGKHMEEQPEKMAKYLQVFDAIAGDPAWHEAEIWGIEGETFTKDENGERAYTESYATEDARMQYGIGDEYRFPSLEQFQYDPDLHDEMDYTAEVNDSTAFEAVYAYGKRIGSEHIMSSAAKAAYANRGKQPVWFLYNTDLRAGGDTGWNSSYMTQLGAVPILDHTLNCGYVKEEWILSYYGSYLSGWLLYNSGGYWDEDAANKGASGWITIASRINCTGQPFKGGMPLKKGCVALSGEAGIGYFGALRTACSIVLDHSVLGRLGLGCRIDRENDEERVTLRDGVSRRLYYVPDRWLLEAEGGYIKEVTIGQEGIRVRAAAWYESGVTVRMLTIPEEGGCQELIACQKTASGGGDGEVYFPGRYTHG